MELNHPITSFPIFAYYGYVGTENPLPLLKETAARVGGLIISVMEIPFGVAEAVTRLAIGVILAIPLILSCFSSSAEARSFRNSSFNLVLKGALASASIPFIMIIFALTSGFREI